MFKKNLEQIIDKKIKKNTLIKESKLSRLWQHVENKIPFAIISSSRGTMSSDEKQKAFNILKKTVRDEGFGFVELKGGYVEKGINGEPDIDITDELSLMIPKISKDKAIKFGQIDLGHGMQDTILYADGDNFLGYIITNENLGQIGSVKTKFNYGKGKDALPMAKKAVSQYFSMLSKGSHKNRKFSFVPNDIKILEMMDRKIPHKEGDWWDNFGFRIL